MKLKKEFATLKTAALALIATAKAEKRPLTADEKADYDTKFARMNEIKTELGKKRADNQIIKQFASQSQARPQPEAAVDDKAEAQLEAVRKFGRGEKIDFAYTSGTNSGVMMPKQIAGASVTKTLTNAVRRALLALGIAPQLSAAFSDNMSVPIFNDSANVANNDQEGATTGVNADANTANSIGLNLVEYHSKAQYVSKKLTRVKDFDITSAIIPAAQSRIERQEEADWVTTLKAAAGVTTTAAAATAIGFQDLTAFDESLVAYAGVPQAILVSPALKLAMRNLKDSQNRPLLDFTNGIETFGGKPVIVSTNLGALTTGQVVALLLAFDGLNGVIVRDFSENEIVKYENVPGYPGQIGYEALGWSACNGNPAAIGKLVMA